MTLISFQFALFFLLVLPVNWLLRPYERLYKPFLLVASYVLYGSLGWKFLLILINFSFFTWLLPLLSARTRMLGMRRVYLILHLCLGLGGLIFFKYYDLIFQSMDTLLVSNGIPNFLPPWDVLLPVGISFFTFQGISYGMDVYRDPDKLATDPLDVMVFVAFFPTIFSGPILRAKGFIPQLTQATLSKESLVTGYFLILSGLVKKMVFSTYLSEHLVQHVFDLPEIYSSLTVFIGAVGYSIQILCDFSGYTDLVMGLALLLGFTIPDNFDRPYCVTNIRVFWHRWHITFSQWLRDYLYFSLGGSRVGEFRKNFNLMLTMTLGGLWHGAGVHFIIWGILHGAGLIVSHFFRKLGAGSNRSSDVREAMLEAENWGQRIVTACSWLITFLFVTFAWIFFGAEDYHSALALIERIFAFDPSGDGTNLVVVCIILFVLAKEISGFSPRKVYVQRIKELPILAHGIIVGTLVTLILRLGPDGVPQFIYFQF